MEIFIPIILILLGFTLILAEVYLIPGFNVVGIIGLLIVLLGIGWGFEAMGTLGGFFILGGTMFLGSGMFYLLWKTGAWNQFILTDVLPTGNALLPHDREHRAKYLGKTGKALTPLRPTGIILINNERLEVATEGEFIAAGSEVRVVAMDRRRFFVRLANDN